ncbi:MAG: hypothetical protein P8N76_04180 [Pirellulaceae bacterium]|nr:hypothetical protein [Pirellulaceae bacterium]
MTLDRIVIAGILTTVTILSSSSTTSGASFHHIESLALNLVRQSSALTREFKYHYRHTPEYRHLVSDARELHRRANHVHNLSHRSCSLEHMRIDLQQMDHFFHHLKETLDRVAMNADRHHRGHVNRKTRHTYQIVRRIEEDLHHLRDDVEAMTRPICEPQRFTPTEYKYEVPFSFGRSFLAPNENVGGIRLGRTNIHFRLDH